MASIPYYADGFTLSNGLMDSGTGNDVTATFSYVTGASFQFLITDTLSLVKIPKNAVILDWLLFVPDIESSTGALTMSLGLLTQSSAYYLTDSQIGRAGGVVTPLLQASISNASVGSPSQQTATILTPLTVTCASSPASTNGYDVFGLTCTASATAAGAGGTLFGWVRYNLRGTIL